MMRRYGWIISVVILSACSLINSTKQFADDAGDQAVDAGRTDAGCELTCDRICTDTQTDPLHCGNCATSCSAPEHSSAVCTDGICGIMCDTGYYPVVGNCEPRAAPRPIAPLSTSTATSRRPTFRWELAPRNDGARIEICADRACTVVLQTVDASGSSGRPSTDLPPGVVFWRLYGREGSEVGAAPSATWQLHIGVRSADDDVDTSWGTTLDVNGDGFADVLVGAPRANSVKGQALLYLGAASGLTTTPVVLDNAVTDGNFGHSVASAGDINGDGYADIVIGAPFLDANAGRAYVYLGGAESVGGIPIELDWAPSNHHFGYSVASAGDVNGDGYADMIIGAPLGYSRAGRAYLYLGARAGVQPTPIVLSNENEGDEFGVSVAGAGDINGDGFADIIIGARYADSGAGHAHIYLGGSGGIESSPDTTLTGDTNDALGTSVASAGDINGDGYADVIVGAPGAAGSSGQALLYLGGTEGLQTEPIRLDGGDGGYFGRSVANAGDVNGDGFADTIVGAPYAGADSGRAYLYLGSPGGPASPAATLDNGLEGGNFGFSVGSPGDVDGDRYSDIIVGAPVADRNNGRAYLYHGSADGLRSGDPTSLQHGDDSGEFGASVVAFLDSSGSQIMTSRPGPHLSLRWRLDPPVS